MITAILAGGFGTRLAEYTDIVPKPMVTIGRHPILWHIMKHYAAYGHEDFVIALGYKGEVVKDYFRNYHAMSSDFSVDLSNGAIEYHDSSSVNWRVTLVDTGAGSMTGGRVRRLKSYLGDERFLLTYGDGLANVDVDRLLAFHESHGRLVTVTAVRPPGRFGALAIDGDQVVDFEEKPQVDQGWINGGFFVMEPAFLDYIADDATVLEKAPLERAARDGQLAAYRHDGYWHCMDTKRDRDHLQALWEAGDPPWAAGRAR